MPHQVTLKYQIFCKTSSMDAEKPLVSVLIPIRPNCPTLQYSLSSIANQSYRNFEVIAVLDRDDGENSKVLTETFPDTDTKIIHTDYSQIGFAEMLNLGIRASNGAFIARHDDDDFSHPQRIKLQIDLLNKFPNTVLVGGWTNVVSPDGNNIYLIKPSQNPALELLSQNVICHSSATFSKQAALVVGGYGENLSGCEDYDLWLKLIAEGEIRAIQSIIVDYLLNQNGMSRSPISKETMKLLNHSRKLAQKHLRIGLIKRLSQKKLWESSQKLANKSDRVVGR
jgi:glycosyltransferase involved in cell wall biosynthesis